MSPLLRASRLRPGNLQPLLGYSLAIASVAIVFLIYLLLGTFAYKIPFLLFHVAIAASAWFGGAGPGLLATALSALTTDYFFLHNPNTFAFTDPGTDAQLALFIVVALLIIGLSLARRQADNHVYEERAKLEATMSSIGDAALTTDMEGRITFMNGVAESLTGWAQQDAIGQPIDQVLKFISPDTRAQIENPVRQVLESGQVLGLINHTLLIARDGSERPIDDSAAPILDNKGRVVGVVMVFRDITARRQTEQANEKLLAQLEYERRRLEDLVSGVPGVVWEAWGKPDEAGQRINFVSSYVEQMLGYSREEWHSTPNFWLTIVHPEDKEQAAQRAANRFVRGEHGTNRFRWLAKDGRALWVEAQDVIIKDEEGNPVGMRGVTMDITDRKQLEDQLHDRAEETEAQRAMLETMVEGVPIGLALIDKDAHILSLNAQWARMTNTGRSARGKILYDVAPPFAERRPQYERVFAGESIDLRDILYSIPGDSTTYYRDIHLRPVRDAHGTVIGMLNAVIDVTKRHEVDLQKDALLALASHELKTPITTIKGYSQLAVRAADQLGDDRLRRALQIIDEQANRLTGMINEMLEVSHLQNPTLPLNADQFDLRELVRRTVESLAFTVPDFTLSLAETPSPAPVFADRGRIEQVVTNLMQNAIKYSGDSRQVEVGIENDQDEQNAQVSVRDYGVGIPADQQSHVFDRFFRARNVSAGGPSGLGLGLYISQEIVTRHGGRIWVDSEEGKGSTFYFTLPLDKGDREVLPDPQ